MSDRRKEQKNHIRAARNWLGQAEHSLEHENDVQGDLKLMLAKAELSRVEDSQSVSRFKYWGIRLLPAAAAVLLVVVGMMLWKAPPSEPAVLQDASPSATEAAEPAPIAPSAAPRGKAETPVSSETSSHTEDRTAEPVSSVLPAEEQPKDTAASNALPMGQVPDTETQKLMQSAGKALRQ